MKPDDPVTNTRPLLILEHSSPGLTRPHLFDRQRGPEREAVPLEVARDPVRHLEVRLPELPIEPDRGDLGDGPAEAPRLRDELDADLEPGVGVDPDLLDERRGVRLE